MEAAKGVGLVQFLRACFMRRNRGFGKAGTVVIDSYGSCSLWSMIVDLWDVVTFGHVLQGRLGLRMRQVATTGLGWTGTCRQVRGVTLSMRQREHVEAARALGASDSRILARHILPLTSSIVLVSSSLGVASTIITESSLSFLGLGVQPPTPSWGNMLSNALHNTTMAPWLVVTPGVCITITVLCIFLIADSIRDALDPQLSA
jgi:ABC-type dipeptide/oligopeptide/nickel transport system permease subunit